ncbi:receptor-type tyrosine-protein phosphatase eta isoform X12 [Bactrocera dorsalis]|uniref:Receptor-type tyrosine-protein phosphatase eta isoform X12 n=1 Tax=Bactrocera dorsalis TaxID=27457 RepID=A0ABM3JD72_BACDO|nr:receptor-type tyrosine-protein phosphatase eta isoform X12 [Bactrocera dorsalis]
MENASGNLVKRSMIVKQLRYLLEGGIQKNMEKKFTICKISIILLILFRKFGVIHCNSLDVPPMDDFVILSNTYSERITFFVNDTEKYEIVDVKCKLMGGVTIDYLGKDTCYDLMPCNSYVATVSIKSLIIEEGGIIERTLYTSTEYSVPDISNITSTKISATELGIYWNVSVKTKKCLEAYKIYLHGPFQRMEEKQISYWNKTKENEYAFENLDPCGIYKLSVYAISINGSSGLPSEIMLQTLGAQPTPVQAVNIISETQALNISWSPSQFADLCVKEYRLTGWINKNSSSQRFDKQTNASSIYINGLYACQLYNIQIIPTTGYTDGEPVITEVETAAKVAMASNIQALAQYPNALELSAVDSNFNNKCETIIARFLCEESKPGNATYKVARQYVEGQVKGVTFKAFLAPLSPYTSYRCGIALFNVAGWSPAEEIILWTLPFIPEKLDDLQVKKIAVDSFSSHNPTKTAAVKFPVDMLNTNLGSIIYMALLVSEKGCNPAPKLEFDSLNSHENWPYVMSWNDAYANNKKICVNQYQVTEVRWNPLSGLLSNETHITYTIGSRTCAETLPNICSNFSECTTEKIYCNGPLKPATEYYLVFRFFTRSGYNDVALLEFATDSIFQLTLIIICICGCLLLSLIAGVSYIWISKRIFWQKDSCHVIEDSLGDIAGKTFVMYFTTLTKPEKLIREYKELAFVATDLSYSASVKGSNKNRYTDIFPYDKNRVLLDVDDEGSDYINASFIDGYKIKKEYIASQGPKPETTIDFWRMILQYNVRVIVMLTQFQEGTNIKCHEYFPYDSNGISVIIRKKTCFEYYDRSEMLITQEKYGLKRKIDHFFFKKWPDHGCPKDPAHLINFIRKIRSYRLSSYSPTVIHCSAGVGRTGTFIALDIIMQRLKYEFKINIYETVKKLRFQRMKMVQTIEQYTFLYESAYELVHRNIKKQIFDENKLIFPHKGVIMATMYNSEERNNENV